MVSVDQQQSMETTGDHKTDSTQGGVQGLKEIEENIFLLGCT